MTALELKAEGYVKKRNGRKMTRHHIIPRSRGGGDIEKNISRIPDRYHVAWHEFFGNMTPKEAIVYIRRLFIEKGKKMKWKSKDMYRLQIEIQAETLTREKSREKK